jgi:hypothetical protein
MTDHKIIQNVPLTRKALQPPHGIELDFAAATFWRTAIWCMACNFAGRQCDMTNSQALKDDSTIIQKIVLHMTFPHETSLALFAEYLSTRIKALAAEPYAMPVVIGLSDSAKGLIWIDNHQIGFDAEGTLQEFSDLATLSYGNSSHERRVVSFWDDRVWLHVTGLLESARSNTLTCDDGSQRA